MSVAAALAPAGPTEDRTTVEHFIAGNWEPSCDGRTFTTHDPHDGSVLATVARGTERDAQRAIAAARTAFDSGPWPRLTARERHAALHRLADVIDAHTEELAWLECRDAGKPIFALTHHEIPRVAHNFRFFADYAAGAGNEAYPDGTLLSYTLYPPAGVVAAISPWNAPLMLATWKVAPALAFGNTVVLKPSPQAPLTCARLAELSLEAGLPDGVLNVVQGFGGDEVAGPLTTDPRVDRITFTGSSATGARIAAAAAPNLTPISAELGGKSANIVFDDADLDVAVPEAIRAIFIGNGQMCLAGSRLFVQDRIRDEFMSRFLAVTATLRVGDPKDPDTFMGPLIEQRHLDKVHGYVELAQQDGAELLAGGGRLLAGELAAGTYYPPTVLDQMTNDMRSAREEIFGPVESVIGFSDEADVIRQVNDSPYGLAGMAFTTDLDRAHRVASLMRAGTVWVNCYFERDLRLPFGGEGISGLGREGGRFSRDFFTEPRAVTVKLHPPTQEAGRAVHPN